MNLRAVVAIDGPAGAGKSTVARRLAELLGYVLLNTGSLYRAVALAAERHGIGWEDEAAVSALAEQLVASGTLQVRGDQSGKARVWLGEQDVTDELSSERMGGGASRVSALPRVRSALLELQRQAGSRGGVVLEGRDIGTVVLPHADVKFFLTASPEVRALRRYRELRGLGLEPELRQIEEQVRERDLRDMTRPVAPLRPAPDAVVIDTSELGVDEVVAVMARRVRQVEEELRDKPAGTEEGESNL